MTQNLISATLKAEDSAEVLQNLANVKNKLSFLLTITPENFSSIIKIGNAYQPFIDKIYQVANEHPEILPKVFNVEEFKRDYELFKALAPILTKINELAESLQKTSYAAGSDTMMAALEIYAAVKQNQDKVPGLKSTADELAVFFKRTRTKNAETTAK